MEGDCTCGPSLWDPKCPIRIHRDAAEARWDEIEWPPLEASERDLEFQYLTEMNLANLPDIFRAFWLREEDLPGLGFLDKKEKP